MQATIHPMKAEASLTIDDIVIMLEEDDFTITLDAFYTESHAWEATLGSFPKSIQFEDANTITIEGWVLCLSNRLPEYVSAQNIYGHHHSCITLAQSALAYRADLPPNGKYFSLTIPLTALLLKNQVRIQIHTNTTSIDAVLVSISCMEPTSRSRSRYISVITSGRSGSTLLTKALNTAKDVISPSKESKEESILRSILMSLLNGTTTAPISLTNFTGQPETYLEPGFARDENPLQSFLTISNLESIYDICWDIALAHYSKLLQIHEPNKNSIIVEKNWCSPIFPLISQRLGILNVVLLRHPVYAANSMIEYSSRTGFAAPFDTGSQSSLVEYIDQSCRSLDWLAKYTPNTLILKYEDLILDPLGEISKIIERLNLSSIATCDVNPQAGDWTGVLQSTNSHRSDAFGLPEDLVERIRERCSDFIRAYYSDSHNEAI
jgi:hypothetical protein